MSSQQSVLIFTSTGALNQATTSKLFNSYKNYNQSPCPVGQSGIFPINSIATPNAYSLFRDNIGHAAGAQILKKDLMVSNLLSVHGHGVSEELDKVIPSPDITISFPGRNLAEVISTRLGALNFRKESNRQQQYYRGAGTETNLDAVLDLHPEMTAYAPYGCTNVLGFLTFMLMKKVLTAAFSAIPGSFSRENATYPLTRNASDQIMITYQASTELFVLQRGAELSARGLFLPYFTSLNIPDKAIIATFIRYFGRILGADAASTSTSISTINNGWKSLATSEAGVVLSHIIFCFDLAIQTGTKPLLYLNGGSYAGVVLSGKHVALLKGSTIYRAPKSRKTLAAAIQNFDLHDTALRNICDILSILPEEGEQEPFVVDIDDVTSGRSLHNYLRRRVLTTEQTKEIRDAVKDLRFPSDNTWSATDTIRIRVAAEHILKGNFLEDDAPMDYRTEGLFTKDHILSTLAAFGTKVPSLCGDGSQTSIVISRGATYTERMFKTPIRGIPIFARPLQQGYEDWRYITRHHTIHFNLGKTTKKDRFLRIPGAGHFIDLDNPEAKELQKLLSQYASESAAKAKDREVQKRSREDDEEHHAERDTKKSKKVRVEVSAVANLFRNVKVDAAPVISGELSEDEMAED